MLNNIGICLVIIKVAINGSAKPVMNFLKSKKEDVRKTPTSSVWFDF
jgi:hypothetical protein